MNDVRADQHHEGQRRTGTLTARPGFSKAKRPFVAKGHDAILKEVQDSEGRLLVTMMSDGSAVEGVLVARDKFTITLLTDEGRRRTLYKHAIESFEPARVQ